MQKLLLQKINTHPATDSVDALLICLHASKCEDYLQPDKQNYIFWHHRHVSNHQQISNPKRSRRKWPASFFSAGDHDYQLSTDSDIQCCKQFGKQLVGRPLGERKPSKNYLAGESIGLAFFCNICMRVALRLWHLNNQEKASKIKLKSKKYLKLDT